MTNGHKIRHILCHGIRSAPAACSDMFRPFITICFLNGVAHCVYSTVSPHQLDLTRATANDPNLVTVKTRTQCLRFVTFFCTPHSAWIIDIGVSMPHLPKIRLPIFAKEQKHLCLINCNL